MTPTDMFGKMITERPVAGNFVGTGMHGGAIYVRGPVEQHRLGAGLRPDPATSGEIETIKPYLKEFCQFFNLDLQEILKEEFQRIAPYNHRPYGNLYAY